MNTKLLTFALITLSNLALTQVEWGYSTTGTFSATGNTVLTDTDENVYFLGQSTSTFDLDPGPEELLSAGNKYYLQKLSPDGELIWAVTNSRSTTDMTRDTAGNLYVTGYFAVTDHFYDIYIDKFDPLGNYLWRKSFGGEEVEFARGITMDASNNILLTGQFKKNVDFDPGPDEHWLVCESSQDVFILKLDSDGNYVNVQHIGGFGTTYSSNICTDLQNNVYITGIYRDSINFYNEPEGFTLTDHAINQNLFVVKFDSTFNYQWSKKLGQSRSFREQQFAVDEDQNVYVSIFNTDEFQLIKIDVTGTETVLASLNSVPVNEDIREPIVTYDYNSKNLYIAEHQGRRIRVSKCDKNGTLLNYKLIVGTSTILINEIAVGVGEKVYLTGLFHGEITAPNLDGTSKLIADDSYLTDSGDSTPDALQIKMDLTGTIEYPKPADLILWPNPTSSVIHFENDPTKSGKVHLYDSSGRLILVDDFYKRYFSLNVSSIAAGTYVLHFEYDGELIIKQFIKF